jgi:hypothetical protein
LEQPTGLECEQLQRTGYFGERDQNKDSEVAHMPVTHAWVISALDPFKGLHKNTLACSHPNFTISLTDVHSQNPSRQGGTIPTVLLNHAMAWSNLWQI